MSSASSAAPSCERALDILEAECAAVCGSGERINAACADLRALDPWSDPSVGGRLTHLAHTVSARVAAINLPVVELLCAAADSLDHPWPVLDNLLASHDTRTIDRVLQTLTRLVRHRPRLIDDDLIAALAARVDVVGGPFDSPAMLERLASILQPATSLEWLLLSATSLRTRRLAARLLDLDSTLPSL